MWDVVLIAVYVCFVVALAFITVYTKNITRFKISITLLSLSIGLGSLWLLFAEDFNAQHTYMIFVWPTIITLAGFVVGWYTLRSK